MPDGPIVFHSRANDQDKSMEVDGCETRTNMVRAAPEVLGEDDLHHLPELRSRIRGYVDTIIRSNMIALEDSAAYLEATTVNADVVQTETDPIQFVRHCNYDLWAGAKRLCLYWKMRKRLFGKRAFLPMVLTGAGALTEQDLYTLKASFPALLPESPTHPKSLLLDRRRCIPDHESSTENKLRCLFYLMKVLAEDDRAQIDGVLVFAVVFTPRFSKLNLAWMHQSIYLTANAFPVKTHLHLLNFVPLQKKESLVTQAVDLVVKVRLAIDLELPFEEQHLDSMRVHVYHDIAVPSVLQAFANTCVDG